MEKKIKRVYVFEPSLHGHHGAYLTWMVQGLLRHGFEIVVITALDSSQSNLDKLPWPKNEPTTRLTLIAAPCDLSNAINVESTISLAKRELFYWRLFKRWCKTYVDSTTAPTILLPYLDYCLYAIGVLGSPFDREPWVGISMRPSFHYHAMGILAPRPTLDGMKKRLLLRALRNQHLGRFLTVDEPLAMYLANMRRPPEKVVFFPEPAELGHLLPSQEAKRRLGLAPERKVILLYGGITSRKGVVELLRALASPGFPAVADVLIAGRVSERVIRERLAEPWVRTLQDEGRLKMIDGYVDSGQERTLFAASDIVWLGYRQHYNSSGLLAQAANASRPVLACEEGVLGWQTNRLGLGRTVRPSDTDEVVVAIAEMLNKQTKQLAASGCAGSWRPPTFSEAQDTLARALMGE